MANKTCKLCKQTKEMSDFYRSNNISKNTDDLGYDYYCKYCRNGSHLKSVANNSKRCTLPDCDRPHYAKGLCRMHGARLKRNGTVERKIRIVKDGIYRSPDGVIVSTRKKRLNRDYKMSLEEYLDRSANGCEICGNKPETTLHVDHDHSCCKSKKTCGKCVRGIVCNKCNAAVDKMENGLMREDYPNYLLIKQYLEAYNARSN